MGISFVEWIAILLIDSVIRALYFVASTFNPLTVTISIAISLFAVTVLFVTNYLVFLFKLRTRTASIVVIFLSISIFSVLAAVAWVSFIKSGEQTSCVAANIECGWIKGTVQPLGAYIITKYIAIQALINIAAFSAGRLIRRGTHENGFGPDSRANRLN